MREDRNFLKRVIVPAFVAVASITVFVGIINIKKQYRDAYDVKALTEEEISEIDTNGAKKLMIVAHPDDELIWGGGHLMDGDYLVVCVTRGYDKVRTKEFKDVVEASGNEPIILSYPDKVAGRRDDWERVYPKIEKDIKLVMDHKDWELIVTHNQKGEYGHQHHKMVHNIVTDIYENDDIKSDLYYFGKYYRKANIADAENDLVKMSDDRIAFKNSLAHYYESQKTVVENLWHMADYEMWEKYGGGFDYADK